MLVLFVTYYLPIEIGDYVEVISRLCPKDRLANPQFLSWGRWHTSYRHLPTVNDKAEVP